MLIDTRTSRRLVALALGVTLSLVGTACEGEEAPQEADTAVTEGNVEEDPAENFVEQDEEGDGQDG